MDRSGGQTGERNEQGSGRHGEATGASWSTMVDVADDERKIINDVVSARSLVRRASSVSHHHARYSLRGDSPATPSTHRIQHQGTQSLSYVCYLCYNPQGKLHQHLQGESNLSPNCFLCLPGSAKLFHSGTSPCMTPSRHCHALIECHSSALFTIHRPIIEAGIPSHPLRR